MPDCDHEPARIDELLAEYALGERAELSGAEREEVEEYLANSSAAREKLADYQVLCGLLADDATVSVPPEIMRRSCQRLEKNLAMAEKTVFPAYNAPILSRFPRLGAYAAAAAVLLVVSLGFLLAVQGFRRPVRSDPAPRPLQPKSTPPACRACKNQTPSVKPKQAAKPSRIMTAGHKQSPEAARMLAELQRRFKTVQDAPRTNEHELAVILELCDRLLDRWSGTGTGVRALRLRADILGERADYAGAMAAFLEYAAAAGDLARDQALAEHRNAVDAERIGRDRTASLVIGRAREHFRHGDYQSAVSLCKGLLGREPGVEQEAAARLFMGRCYERLERPIDAIAVYQEVAVSKASLPVRKTAYSKLSLANFNCGQYHNAIAALEQMYAICRDDYWKASVLMRMACMEQALGRGHYPSALAALDRLVRSHPHSSFVSTARKMRQHMQNAFADDLMKGLLQ